MRKGGEEVRKELEYVKKIALLAKLFRLELLIEKEYERIRRKLIDSYLIAGERSDDLGKAIALKVEKTNGRHSNATFVHIY